MLKRKITCYLFCLFSLAWTSLQAQTSSVDTLSLLLTDAESRLVKGNLFLLAQQMNLDASRALQLQAGLWSNPSLYLEQSVYNPASRRLFPTQSGEAGNPSTQGETIVQFNQLFLLAGKRGKQVNLARINSEMTEYQYYDLVRSLKYELRTHFFSLYYLQQSLRIYGAEITSLQNTADLYQTQYEKGNVPLKEVVRLKAFLFTLQNDRRTLLARVSESQANLGLLLNDSVPVYYQPTFDKPAVERLDLPAITLAELTEEALVHRFDLKADEAATRYEKQNLALQKALAIPDIRLGGVFDRNGSYIQNYYGLNMQIDLPLFNRNQGNIQSAQSRILANQAIFQQNQRKVQKEVWQAYQKSQQAQTLVKSFDPSFEADFDRLIDGISLSYQKRNITLLEFIDFYESYKNNVLQLNQLQADRINALEELNYVTGKDWFTY